MLAEAINSVNEFDQTVLHFAALGGDKDIFAMVLNLIPKAINAVDKYGQTVLHSTAEGGNKDICGMVLDLIPEASNIANKHGRTALHLTIKQGNKEVCELLIPKMSSDAINAIDIDGKTALHLAADEKGLKEVCELLVQRMSSEAINAFDVYNNTALHLAANKGFIEVCTILIDNMCVKNIEELLYDTKLKNMLTEIVAGFIGEKFSSNECSIALDRYQVRLLKLYQVVDQDSLVGYLNKEEDVNLHTVNRVNNYIAGHYCTLIGVCNSIEKNNPLSMLVASSDCMSHVLSYLVPHSLFLPELFTCVELVGEDVISDSENVIS